MTASGPKMRPPRPSTAASQPTLAEPRANRFRAMMTVRTLSTPRANVWAAAGTNSATASRCRTPASKPATRSSLSCRRRPAPGTGAGVERGRTPVSNTAATATNPQETSMAACAVPTASRAAAIAGPPTMAADCSTLAAVFALVSSSGVRASQGSRAACIWRKALASPPSSPTSTTTRTPCPPPAIAAAATPSRSARGTTMAISSRSRRTRSDPLVTTGTRNAPGSALSSPSTATSPAPPAWNA